MARKKPKRKSKRRKDRVADEFITPPSSPDHQSNSRTIELGTPAFAVLGAIGTPYHRDSDIFRNRATTAKDEWVARSKFAKRSPICSRI